MSAPDDLDGAACAEPGVDPDWFFTQAHYGEALAVCRRCDSADACRRRAIHYGDIDRDGVAVHGVIAGVAPATKGTGPTMHRCELAACGRLFMGNGSKRYCCGECALRSRADAKALGRAEAKRDGRRAS